jgi:glycosyltransferase involved in cell wall biosynthesis
MKISIGSKIQYGPWGGGNQFAINLSQYLLTHGDQVCFNLEDPDIDVILLTEPRINLRVSAYGSREIIKYLLLKNPNAIIVHRINECDERKGSSTINRLIMAANKIADHTVYVSAWLKELYSKLGLYPSNHVILNGANTDIFHRKGCRLWERDEPLRLVTHHWGNHWLKGFDIYEKLDQLLNTPKYKGKIAFTYIGHLPIGFNFSHTTFQSPLFGEELANNLRKNHVYLTASRNEPGSNHQNEGACCGLPILYIKSGSLPEYCDGFGISFLPENFDEKLDEMIENYEFWASRMDQFPHTADRMCAAYTQLFQDLLDQRAEIISKRTWVDQTLFKADAFLPRRPLILLSQKVKEVLRRWIG